MIETALTRPTTLGVEPIRMVVTDVTTTETVVATQTMSGTF